MLLFFLLVGRTLDHAVRRKTRAVAGNLAALKADTAHRFMGDELVSVPVAVLKAGDRLLVKPGERVPADGTVLRGNSEIDESIVTGETARRRIGPGNTVYAGCTNYSGALTLQVTAAGGTSLIDEIEKLLDKAAGTKSRTMRLADRAARIYAPVVHLTAALTFIGWLAAGASIHDALITAIAVLIITCPCALALAIPAVQVVASGALFRSGVILNAGDAIERLAGVDIVVFDKTGTLTLPEPRVVNVTSLDSELLEAAARLALSSRHPLAVALSREAIARTPFDGAVEHPGQGVCAIVEAVEMRLGSPEFCNVVPTCESPASVICFRHGNRSALIEIAQSLRPDAVEVVRSLRERGLDLCILSGDRAESVAPVAKALGIESWQARLKPADKIARVEEWKAHGCRVAMIGDGLNDAPSLAAARVSLSPISAADLTQAHADAVFLGEKLKPVLDAIIIARRARSLMIENLRLAMIYNAIAVPVAIAGAVTPLIAALAMSGSSLIVTLNALRAGGRRL
jgi:Cu2+-exporting ATPase